MAREKFRLVKSSPVANIGFSPLTSYEVQARAKAIFYFFFLSICNFFLGSPSIFHLDRKKSSLDKGRAKNEKGIPGGETRNGLIEPEKGQKGKDFGTSKLQQGKAGAKSGSCKKKKPPQKFYSSMF